MKVLFLSIIFFYSYTALAQKPEKDSLRWLVGVVYSTVHNDFTQTAFPRSIKGKAESVEPKRGGKVGLTLSYRINKKFLLSIGYLGVNRPVEVTILKNITPGGPFSPEPYYAQYTYLSTYGYKEVPLYLNYKYGDERWYGSIGFGVLYSKYVYYKDDVTYFDIKGYNLSAGGALSINYLISNRLVLSLEPNYSHVFYAKSSQYTYSFGVALSLNYRFNASIKSK